MLSLTVLLLIFGYTLYFGVSGLIYFTYFDKRYANSLRSVERLY